MQGQGGGAGGSRADAGFRCSTARALSFTSCPPPPQVTRRAASTTPLDPLGPSSPPPSARDSFPPPPGRNRGPRSPTALAPAAPFAASRHSLPSKPPDTGSRRVSTPVAVRGGRLDLSCSAPPDRECWATSLPQPWRRPPETSLSSPPARPALGPPRPRQGLHYLAQTLSHSNRRARRVHLVLAARAVSEWRASGGREAGGRHREAERE